MGTEHGSRSLERLLEYANPSDYSKISYCQRQARDRLECIARRGSDRCTFKILDKNFVPSRAIALSAPSFKFREAHEMNIPSSRIQRTLSRCDDSLLVLKAIWGFAVFHTTKIRLARKTSYVVEKSSDVTLTSFEGYIDDVELSSINPKNQMPTNQRNAYAGVSLDFRFSGSDNLTTMVCPSSTCLPSAARADKASG